MKNAHRTEMEKELDKARKANSNSGNADVEEIRRQHEYVRGGDVVLGLVTDVDGAFSSSVRLLRRPLTHLQALKYLQKLVKLVHELELELKLSYRRS